ncbi:hypothetical protein C8F04DRAFT_1398873 [Mycena alexandri]|uniref:MYND-type domain-containing protein n=1 Tax=Mycena alexandri TaxID=1745969 RepID=A0AAD6SJS1_9AGAR|nr:hypothetical protein C8F04DRAFT_1398873 [Mycena alexandri]
MDLKCDNSNCPSASSGEAAPKLLVCSGCSAVRYCSKDCQTACWKVHNQVCWMHPAPLSGLRLRVEPENKAGCYAESDDECHRETEYSAHKIINVKIEKTTAQETIEVGTIKIQVIDIAMTNRNGGFFECVNEYSHELGKLALHFDARGRLRPNRGCWQPQDFRNEPYLVYLEEFVIQPAWRGKGLGTWVLPKLFHLEALNGTQYIFTWPTVLGYLEPPLVNGPFGNPTPAEQAAWTIKRDRIIRFYQKAGFRRLANSNFFCFAKNTSHLSYTIAIEEDAPVKELPPPTTEEEVMRRYLANH